jgi:hypothetical protein
MGSTQTFLRRKKLLRRLGNGIFAPVGAMLCVKDWDRALLLCTKILF